MYKTNLHWYPLLSMLWFVGILHDQVFSVLGYDFLIYSRLGIVIWISGEESISSQSRIFSLGITSPSGS